VQLKEIVHTALWSNCPKTSSVTVKQPHDESGS